MHNPFWRLILIVWALLATGCAGTKALPQPSIGSNSSLIQRQSNDLRVTLLAIIGEGYDGTLVEDAGWREFLLQIENRATGPLTVENVKLLNVNGRYVDSAASHSEITAPPDVGAELAADVATDAAGIVAGYFIPFGGFLTNVINSAASASSADTKASAKREFALRAIKKVELAPAGRMAGSAFLPNITNAKTLVIDYTSDDRTVRLEIPLPTQAP